MDHDDRFGSDTYEIIGACIEVHRLLGPGLLESAYEECLAHELGLRGIPFARQVPLPLRYKSIAVDGAYQADLIVRQRVILELKTVRRLTTVHRAQPRTYLRFYGAPVGLLVNFEVPALVEDGIRRVTLPSPSPRLPFSRR